MIDESPDRSSPDPIRRLKKAVAKALRSERPSEAADLAEQVLNGPSLPPDSVDRHMFAGMRLFALRDYASAVAEFDRARDNSISAIEATTWRLRALRRLSLPSERRAEVYLVSRASTYRSFAASHTRPEDTVVELGASTGSATVVLARHSRLVIAVEKCEEPCRMAAARLLGAQNVKLLRCNAWDTGCVLEITDHVDAVFVDIGGSAGPWQTMELAGKYERLFSPRLMVLRNTSLNGFVASLTYCERPSAEETPDEPKATPCTI